jgi:hypothetical protein
MAAPVVILRAKLMQTSSCLSSSLPRQISKFNSILGLSQEKFSNRGVLQKPKRPECIRKYNTSQNW